jgi:hypothetical protein
MVLPFLLLWLVAGTSAALVTIPCATASYTAFASNNDYVISNCAGRGPMTLTALSGITLTITNCDLQTNSLLFSNGLTNAVILIDRSRFNLNGALSQNAALQFTNGIQTSVTLTIRDSSIIASRTNGAFAAVGFASTSLLGSLVNMTNTTIDVTSNLEASAFKFAGGKLRQGTRISITDTVAVTTGTSNAHTFLFSTDSTVNASAIEVRRSNFTARSLGAYAINMFHITRSGYYEGASLMITDTHLTSTAALYCRSVALQTSSPMTGSCALTLRNVTALSQCSTDTASLMFNTDSPVANGSIVLVQNSRLTATSATTTAVSIYHITRSGVLDDSAVSVVNTALMVSALGSFCRTFSAYISSPIARRSQVLFEGVTAIATCQADGVSLGFSTDSPITNSSLVSARTSSFVVSSVASNAVSVYLSTRSGMLGSSVLTIADSLLTVTNAGTYCRGFAAYTTSSVTDNSTVTMTNVSAATSCPLDALSILFNIDSSLANGSTFEVRDSKLSARSTTANVVNVYFITRTGVLDGSSFLMANVVLDATSATFCRALCTQSVSPIARNSRIVFENVTANSTCQTDSMSLFLNIDSAIMNSSTLLVANSRFTARSLTASATSVNMNRDSGVWDHSAMTFLNSQFVSTAATSCKFVVLWTNCSISDGSQFTIRNVSALAVCTTDAQGIVLTGYSPISSSAAVTVIDSRITTLATSGVARGLQLSTRSDLSSASLSVTRVVFTLEASTTCWGISLVDSTVTAGTTLAIVGSTVVTNCGSEAVSILLQTNAAIDGGSLTVQGSYLASNASAGSASALMLRRNSGAAHGGWISVKDTVISTNGTSRAAMVTLWDEGYLSSGAQLDLANISGTAASSAGPSGVVTLYANSRVEQSAVKLSGSNVLMQGAGNVSLISAQPDSLVTGSVLNVSNTGSFLRSISATVFINISNVDNSTIALTQVAATCPSDATCADWLSLRATSNIVRVIAERSTFNGFLPAAESAVSAVRCIFSCNRMNGDWLTIRNAAFPICDAALSFQSMRLQCETRSMTRTRSLPPTLTRQLTKTFDLPTPVPPTPAPTPVPPTPVPPTPAPTLTFSQTVSHPRTASRDLPTPAPPPWASITATTDLPEGMTLRRAAAINVAATVSLANVLPDRHPVNLTLVVTFEASNALAIPPCAAMPTYCHILSVRVARCRVPYFTNPVRRFTVPFLRSLDPSATSATVEVNMTLETWSLVSVQDADLEADAPSASVAVKVPLAVGVASITAVTPSMNQMSYGAVITITGQNLRSLPAMVPIGPLMLPVHVSSSNSVATVILPALEDSWIRAATNATVRDELLVWSHGVPSATYFICGLLSAVSAQRIDSIRQQTLLGSPVDLSRFNVDFNAAEVLLNPSGRAPADAVPEAEILIGADGNSTLVVSVFVPGNPPSYAKDLIAIITLPGDPATHTSNGVQQQVPVVDPATGEIVGYWVYFTFPGPLVDLTDTDASTTGSNATIVTGSAIAPVIVTVTDAAKHTSTTTSTNYTVPTYTIRIVALPPYRCRLTMKVITGRGIVDLRLLAYTDAALSLRPYAPRSDSDGCKYDAVNVSTTCNRALLSRTASVSVPSLFRRRQEDSATANTTWSVDLFAAVPNYATSGVFVRAHVRASNADWKELVLRLTRDPSDSGVLVEAPLGPNGGLAPVPTEYITSDLTPSPTSDTAPSPSKEPLKSPLVSFGGAIVRSVFRLDSTSCDSSRVGFIPATLLFFVCGVIPLHVIIAKMRHRGDLHPEDRVRTVGVRSATSFASQHLYVGLLMPCHGFCGPVHAVLLAVHVFSIFLFATTLQELQRGVALDGWRGASAHGAATAVLVVLLQPVFNVAFSMYTVTDKRTYAVRTCSNVYAPTDLEVFGIARKSHVGLSDDTLHAIGAIAFDKENHAVDVSDSISSLSAPDELTHDLRQSDVAASPATGSTAALNSASDRGLPPQQAQDLPSCLHEGGPPHSPASPSNLVTPRSRCDANADATTPSSPAEASPAPLSDSGTITASLNSESSDPHRCDQPRVTCRDPRACIVVNARRYTVLGFLLCVASVVVMVLIVSQNTARWCDAHFAAMWRVVTMCLIFDTMALQPLYVALYVCWRWLRTEDGDPVAHELHPIHGQWRHEGKLPVGMDIDDTDAASTCAENASDQ